MTQTGRVVELTNLKNSLIDIQHDLGEHRNALINLNCMAEARKIDRVIRTLYTVSWILDSKIHSLINLTND